MNRKKAKGVAFGFFFVLLKYMAKKKVKKLVDAVVDGDIKTVKLLLGAGVSPNAKDEDGGTALQWASMKGFTEIVKLLLDKGANLKAKDEEGETALSRASQYGLTEIVKLLLDKGAKIDAKNNDGETALTIASQWGYTEIVKILLDAGANLEARDKDGRTALIGASQGRTKVVKLLLAKGAKIDAKNNDGETALMLASMEGHTETVKLLLAKGADINIKDRDGKTAYDYIMVDAPPRKNDDNIRNKLKRLLRLPVIELIAKEIQGKKQPYKWQSLCKPGVVKLDELREQAKLFKIKDGNKKSKRELCAELAKKIDEKSKKGGSTCENDSTISGDDIKDIPKELLYKHKEGGRIYCFNILEIIKLDKNPYTRDPLPKEKIKAKYEKLEKILVSSRLAPSLIEKMKELRYFEKNKDAMLNLKITNLASKLRYVNPDGIKKMTKAKIKKLDTALRSYDLTKPLSKEMSKFDKNKDLETFVEIYSRILNIGDSNTKTRAVIFEEEYNKVNSGSGSAARRGSSGPGSAASSSRKGSSGSSRRDSGSSRRGSGSSRRGSGSS